MRLLWCYWYTGWCYYGGCYQLHYLYASKVIWSSCPLTWHYLTLKCLPRLGTVTQVNHMPHRQLSLATDSIKEGRAWNRRGWMLPKGGWLPSDSQGGWPGHLLIFYLGTAIKSTSLQARKQSPTMEVIRIPGKFSFPLWTLQCFAAGHVQVEGKAGWKTEISIWKDASIPVLSSACLFWEHKGDCSLRSAQRSRYPFHRLCSAQGQSGPTPKSPTKGRRNSREKARFRHPLREKWQCKPEFK